ncbi:MULTISPECIES: SURF1 family protein [Thioclava]|uniref:SURF1-like protein n=1 Tax=Thioclava litoralis TaxID=3076557 RepID=A0ABZ1DVP0_9RHOB|nr:SURF1 family protein [Thioclava sp. FTW29]
MSRNIRWVRLSIATILAAGFVAVFMSLGIWQVHRLHWKLDLIARVDSRVAAAPVPAPGPNAWAGLTREGDEYRHVAVTGTFLNDQEVQIYTPSMFGPGYWVLTPLKRDDGTIVMINRGVVPEEKKSPASRVAPAGVQHITGLLRLSEDHGWLFSQKDRPQDGVWYRRDIASITQTKGLENAAPYFIDQDLTDPEGFPRGGQTVVKFRNSHLSYAITWFAMALLSLVGWGVVLRQELKNRD